MKKVITLAAFASMLAFVACGPDKEKLRQDSIRVADSLAKVQAAADSARKADSIAAAEKAAKEAAAADSARKADSIKAAEEAAAKKGGSKPKPKEAPKPKAGTGKG